MSATGLFMGTCPCSLCSWFSALELGPYLVCPVFQITCAVATAQGRRRVAALPPAVGWQYVVEQIGSATGFAGQQIEAVPRSEERRVGKEGRDPAAWSHSQTEYDHEELSL